MNQLNYKKNMTEYSKSYDDKQYTPNTEYTILVLSKEVDRLKEILKYTKSIKEINRQLIEVQNTIAFLKEYR